MATVTRWPLVHEIDAFACAGAAMAFAAALGLTRRAQCEMAIVVSELATNALKYGGGGTVELIAGTEPPHEIEVRVEDHGPGLASDIGDGFTARPYAPDRRGLGLGLGAVRRLSDRVVLETPARGGTRVRAFFRRGR